MSFPPILRQKIFQQIRLAKPVRDLLELLIACSVMAFLCAVAPLISGNNHNCPVLRENSPGNSSSAQAVPAFARKYNVDCIYCHTAWPQLNRTGYIFRRLGYRMPWEVPKMPEAASDGPAQPSPQTSNSGAPLPPSTVAALNKGINSTGGKPPSAVTIADGQKLFSQMQCFTCHANGENLINPAKPIKGQGFLKKYPEDAQIAQILRKGLPGTAMPAYGKDRIADEQLVSLIAYIRSLTPPEMQ